MFSSRTVAAERAAISPQSPMWGEHRSRYKFASDYVRDKLVLDIACGTGFGEPILVAAGAKAVIATDYSAAAARVTNEMRTARTSVLRTDGTNLPFSDETFDVVTSFETVEHIAQCDRFVGELRRVLKSDGVMIMSTPNALYTRPINGTPRNPYHVYEFTPIEFDSLLLRHFVQVDLVGQRVSKRYRICPYWELPEMLPNDPLSRFKIIVNKIQSRLPVSIREGLSKALQGRSFFPGEDDFVFSREELEVGYVQVAVCRP